MWYHPLVLSLLGLCPPIASAAESVALTRNVKPTYTLKDATDNVQSIAFSADNRWIASAAYDNKVRVYSTPANNTRQPHLEHTLKINTTDTAWTVAFTPDAKWMAVGQVGIELYDTDSFKLRHIADNKMLQNFVAFSADGELMATVTGDDQNVWLYAMSAGKPEFSRKLKSGSASKGLPLNTVAFSPDGKWLASGGSEDNSLWIHALDSGNETRTWKEPKQVDSLAFSADSKWLVAGLNDDLGGPSRVYAYAMDQMSNYSWQAAPNDFVAAVSFSPDGKWLAVGCGDAKVRMYAWMGNSKPTLHCIMVGAEDAVSSVAFSPDGKWLAAGTETQHVLLYSGWEGEGAGTTIVV